jgi:hypothetical protein
MCIEKLTFSAPYNRRKQEKECKEKYVMKPIK